MAARPPCFLREDDDDDDEHELVEELLARVRRLARRVDEVEGDVTDLRREVRRRE